MPHQFDKMKMSMTVVLIVCLLLSAIPTTRTALFEGHLFDRVDSAATEYVDDSLIRAGSAFAIARTFNAIVSVFQESQLQLEPGGVGVSLALGAALDPANDLVERFSWVMLVSLTSLGIQKVLIEITPFVSVQIVLMLALLSLLAGLWLKGRFPYDFVRLGRVLIFVAILLRFAVPLMAFVNNQVYVTFLENRYNLSVASLSKTVATLETQQIESTIRADDEGEGSRPDGENGWWERTKSAVSQTVDQGAQMLDVRKKLEAVKLATLDLIDRIVDLIVVFALSTIVLPLLFFWGLLRLGRLVVGRGFAPAALSYPTEHRERP